VDAVNFPGGSSFLSYVSINITDIKGIFKNILKKDFNLDQVNESDENEHSDERGQFDERGHSDENEHSDERGQFDENEHSDERGTF